MLHEGVSVEGLVTGLHSEELVDVVVRATRGGDSRRGIPDLDGRFTIHGLGAGEWRFLASGAGAGGRLAARAVEIQLSSPPAIVELAFAAGFRIVGDAVLLGEPLSGALVTARVSGGGNPRTVSADRRGRFVFDGLPPGRYDLTVRHGRGVGRMTAVELNNHREHLSIDIGLAALQGN